MGFDRALAEVVSNAGIPYGYTLTVWGTGALCVARLGLPSAGEVFLFAAGGSIAYAALAWVSSQRGATRVVTPPPALWENVVALPVLGAVYGLDRVVTADLLSFFLSPLVATSLYLLGLALLVSRLQVRESVASPR